MHCLVHNHEREREILFLKGCENCKSSDFEHIDENEALINCAILVHVIGGCAYYTVPCFGVGAFGKIHDSLTIHACTSVKNCIFEIPLPRAT